MKNVKYKCKDNDVRLEFVIDDNDINEVWIGFKGQVAWTVVGYYDLLAGVDKAYNKIAKRV